MNNICCGAKDECSNPVIIRENFCIDPASEIFAVDNCGCNIIYLDLCKAYNNGKITSVDGTIGISPFPLKINGIDQCGLDFSYNGEYYIRVGNGGLHKVFCPMQAEPNKRVLCLEGRGLDILFEAGACDSCCGGACDKVILSVTDASVSKGFRVGCSTDSEGQLNNKIVRKPNGYIDWLFDCSFFSVTLSDPNNDNGGIPDRITISPVSMPIMSINDVRPNQSGEYRICADEPLSVVASGSMCSNTPGTKVSLSYNKNDFEIKNGELSLKISDRYDEVLVYGATSAKHNIDPAIENPGAPYSNDPSWTIGGITMDIWEKKIDIGTVTIPYDAPNGYKWVLDINIHCACYPLHPSGGNASSPIPAPAVVQVKAYVNNSLVSDVSGMQREMLGYTISPNVPSRGDATISGVYNVPQSKGSVVPVGIILQYSVRSGYRSNMQRVEVNELSFSGFLRLVKIT